MNKMELEFAIGYCKSAAQQLGFSIEHCNDKDSNNDKLIKMLYRAHTDLAEAVKVLEENREQPSPIPSNTDLAEAVKVLEEDRESPILKYLSSRDYPVMLQLELAIVENRIKAEFEGDSTHSVKGLKYLKRWRKELKKKLKELAAEEDIVVRVHDRN